MAYGAPELPSVDGPYRVLAGVLMPDADNELMPDADNELAAGAVVLHVVVGLRHLL
jgi:hypothetical protein